MMILSTALRAKRTAHLLGGFRDCDSREAQVMPTSHTGRHGQQPVVDPQARPRRLR
jgi:hypothetical protein